MLALAIALTPYAKTVNMMVVFGGEQMSGGKCPVTMHSGGC